MRRSAMPNHRRPPHAAAAALLLAAALALPLMALLARRPRLALARRPGQLAIPLHPARHAARAPATLSFRWNVTLASRAPDGVDKPVYLVNGRHASPHLSRHGPRRR